MEDALPLPIRGAHPLPFRTRIRICLREAWDTLCHFVNTPDKIEILSKELGWWVGKEARLLGIDADPARKSDWVEAFEAGITEGSIAP